MGQIQNQFDKIIKKVIDYYAKEYNVNKETVQIQFYLKETGAVINPDDSPIQSLATPEKAEAGYKICIAYQPKKELKVIDVIHPGKNFKIDFTGISLLVHPFVAKIILELAVE